MNVQYITGIQNIYYHTQREGWGDGEEITKPNQDENSARQTPNPDILHSVSGILILKGSDSDSFFPPALLPAAYVSFLDWLHFLCALLGR